MSSTTLGSKPLPGASALTVSRGPTWLWVLITAASIVIVGYLRLGLFPERFVPLSNILVMLICLWHRDLRLLWAMVFTFSAMVVVKVALLVPDTAAPGNLEWVFGLMQLANIWIAGIIIDRVIRLAIRVEATMALLNESNAELEASNEELAAREEEITQQNEELQSQTEELEQQGEELNSQAEELQTLNDELSERERTLRELLDATAQDPRQESAMTKLGETIVGLLGHRACAAAVVEPGEGEMRVRPLFGMDPGEQSLSRDATVADLVLARNRVAGLADVKQRPDLSMPRLADGNTVRAVASSPMEIGDSTGTLELYSAEPGEWQEHDLRLLQWLAEQCGRMLTMTQMRAEREAVHRAERLARSEADRANKAKDEFVAMLSHELRSPLNAVLGWATVLRSGTLPPEEVAQGLEVIERNARQQGQLISDLLDISRIVTGKLHLDARVVDLPSIVESAVECIRATADAKDVRVECMLGQTSRELVGDPVRLQQVVWNLLTNAVKFTGAEGVVQVVVTEQPDHVELSVSDSGEGVEPAQLPYLFERYRQADPSSTRRHGGLGLGLAIVKDLVELHGGSVEAHSDGVGQGARFLVRLPVRESRWSAQEQRAASHPAPASSGFEAPTLAGLTILVVDDEQDARLLLTHILTERGAVVHEATSGEEAIGKLEALDPDILISDIAMPGMDGYELIRVIRDRAEESNRPLPAALALTAFARTEDRTQALLAGYQAHVAKPVEPAELVATVASLRFAVGRRA
jgi:signal transduction histidine kinase/ActR/RegA family two-component response regulator